MVRGRHPADGRHRAGPDRSSARSSARRRTERGDPAPLLPIGQDGWLAAVFSDRWPDTAAAVRGIREAMLDALLPEPERRGRADLSPGSALAQTLGIRLPIAQGPMTRVSDEAGFAAAVAADRRTAVHRAGAWPTPSSRVACSRRRPRLSASDHGASASSGSRPRSSGPRSSR